MAKEFIKGKNLVNNLGNYFVNYLDAYYGDADYGVYEYVDLDSELTKEVNIESIIEVR